MSGDWLLVGLGRLARHFGPVYAEIWYGPADEAESWSWAGVVSLGSDLRLIDGPDRRYVEAEAERVAREMTGVAA